MAWPFTEENNHRIYKNTTLQNVVIVFELEPQGTEFYNDSFYERLDKFTTDKFSLKVEHALFDNPFQIHNAKLHSFFQFANGMVAVILPREGYVSFEDTAMPQIRRMREYVNEVLLEQCVKRVHIRKLNIWQIVEIKEDPQIVLNRLKPEIFSESFLTATNHLSYEPNEQNILFEKMGWTEGNENIIARAAYVPVKDRNAAFNIVLDIETSIGDQDAIVLEGMSTKLLNWNRHMFNVFQWSLNHETIKRMEGEI